VFENFDRKEFFNDITLIIITVIIGPVFSTAWRKHSISIETTPINFLINQALGVLPNLHIYSSTLHFIGIDPKG